MEAASSTARWGGIDHGTGSLEQMGRRRKQTVPRVPQPTAEHLEAVRLIRQYLEDGPLTWKAEIQRELDALPDVAAVGQWLSAMCTPKYILAMMPGERREEKLQQLTQYFASRVAEHSDQEETPSAELAASAVQMRRVAEELAQLRDEDFFWHKRKFRGEIPMLWRRAYGPDDPAVFDCAGFLGAICIFSGLMPMPEDDGLSETFKSAVKITLTERFLCRGHLEWRQDVLAGLQETTHMLLMTEESLELLLRGVDRSHMKRFRIWREEDAALELWTTLPGFEGGQPIPFLRPYGSTTERIDVLAACDSLGITRRTALRAVRKVIKKYPNFFTEVVGATAGATSGATRPEKAGEAAKATKAAKATGSTTTTTLDSGEKEQIAFVDNLVVPAELKARLQNGLALDADVTWYWGSSPTGAARGAAGGAAGGAGAALPAQQQQVAAEDPGDAEDKERRRLAATAIAVANEQARQARQARRRAGVLPQLLATNAGGQQVGQVAQVAQVGRVGQLGQMAPTTTTSSTQKPEDEAALVEEGRSKKQRAACKNAQRQALKQKREAARLADADAEFLRLCRPVIDAVNREGGEEPVLVYQDRIAEVDALKLRRGNEKRQRKAARTRKASLLPRAVVSQLFERDGAAP